MSRHDPWFPEGILVPVLLITLVGIAAFSVQIGGWTNLVIPIGVVGVVAALFGTVIAKLRVIDSLAHLLALVCGVGLVSFMVLLQADILGESLRDRVKPLGLFLVDWYLGKRPPDDHEDLLISMLMGVIVWLVGYLASWTLFRRGWLLAGVALPGFLLLMNLGYAPEPRPWMLALMVALAIPLCARYYLYQRERTWAMQRMAGPRDLASRFIVFSTVIALLVTGLSWRAPSSWSQQAFQPLFREFSQSLTHTQERASRWLEDAAGGRSSEVEAGPYTSFDNAFSIGGPLRLSDEPEVLVRTDAGRGPYLTAHHYDVYTGRGWSSGIDEQFESVAPNGKTYSPELTFRANQGVVLSGDVTGGRVEQTMEVTPLNGNGDVVFSSDTYSSANIRTAVRMSWRQLEDEPFAISRETLLDLPPDLQRIGGLLLQSDLTGGQGKTGPQAAEEARQKEIDAELEKLKGRFLTVRWTASADGVVDTLYVTGQIPVYDDVEAVFPRETADGRVSGSYEVTSLTSTADAASLMQAGQDYPGWVSERYLQLSDSVTPRTTDLAMKVTAGAATPYEQAVLIEEYLRQTIVYDENVTEPPPGADVVDYVLFEQQRGYCEHYSSAMTVMMRALGVPARTVVGYYPGQYDEQDGGYVYRQRNAHAWTEVFFPGYGWIAFEPTAGRPLTERDATQVNEVTEPTPEPLASEESAVETPVASPVADAPAIDEPLGPSLTPSDQGGGRPGWLLPVGGALLVVVIGAGFAWMSWTWKLRGLPPSAAMFTRLLRLGRLAGVSPGATMTPREYADAFSRSVPAAGKSARQIVRVYELDQYGPDGADAGLLASAGEAWRRLRGQLPRMIFRRRRT
ncbi:MAG TPA: transglutaminase domain-containing protein [Thermomicrobiales bacterium]|nr:transglutaminase domain-containing protein [Thermomicrobiales bacterium]